ncbi:major facilitator superfamily domain-containing protein [Dactylonectria macrodidyma]|uniref:Major facilitator superfamily domain-containing protein n=1 Tax=Dactylonectria macrodidyma TaxID=307937 RepID=A0A9P9EIH6_9HYPO|nr:major facilitator superfamily domain-containing protein [Dactylonectria macrodidyma]
MADAKEPQPVEQGELSANEKPTDVHHECIQLLADLPNPDAEKATRNELKLYNSSRDRKLMWKVDLWLIPWLALLYLLSFLDRTNIGNARLAGMELDLGMSGTDYNLSLTIFFISYAVFEPLTNALLKRLTPRIFFTSIIVGWGTIMTLMGLVTNFRGPLAARWFLGIAEAGLFPGVNYYLSCWHKGSEIGMDGIGGKPGWAWIFIIEGLATAFVGVFCWWMVFDWPENARFLSPDDRVRVQRRIISDRQGRTAEDFDKRHIYEALKDCKTYGCLVPLYAFSLFLPTILGGMGYQGTHAQLMSVAPYAAAATVTVAVGFLADRTRWRGYLNMVTVTIGIVGFLMLISTSNPKVQYAGTFFGAIGIYPTIPNTLSWIVNNTEGSLKRAVVLGLVVGWGNLNGVVSSNIYLVKQAPRFWTGHSVVLGYQVVFLLGASIFMHFALARQNKLQREGKMDEKWDAMTEEQRWVAGDRRPDFTYTI